MYKCVTFWIWIFHMILWSQTGQGLHNSYLTVAYNDGCSHTKTGETRVCYTHLGAFSCPACVNWLQYNYLPCIKKWNVYIYLKKKKKAWQHLNISRVPSQNGVPQAWFRVEIHHSGRKPSIYKWFCLQSTPKPDPYDWTKHHWIVAHFLLLLLMLQNLTPIQHKFLMSDSST